MRAVTLRRSIVFGVCAIGVCCLYLAPSLARSPDQVGLQPLGDEPTGRPATTPRGDSARPSATGTTHVVSAPNGGSSPGTVAAGGDGPTTDNPHGQRRAGRGATAYDPDDTHDREPPTAVASIRSATVTPRRLGLTWAPAADNVGVVGYRIWVNGFAVATTAETHATVRWFNDDSGQHVVQVRAIDAEGNESETSPSLVVTRPSTEPSPTPVPTPTSDPTVTAKPSPQPSPSTSAEPTGKPTETKTPAAPEPSPSPTG